MAKGQRNFRLPNPGGTRDTQDQGNKRSLTVNSGGNDYGFMSYGTTVSLGFTPGIQQGNGADWFGPLNPMSPTAPIEVEGRRFDFPSGYNLIQIPRAYESISFSEMRALADAYDILRLVIETRKDQMEKLNWSIQPRKNHKGEQINDEDDSAIVEISRFLERPDGKNDWGAWLRGILEDMLVIDAASLYCHETYGGKLLGLEQIDGATIKRVIDDWGRTPEPPVPAYQQVLKGLPAVDYTADQLIYLPRNARVHKVYGYSPVEQIIMTINIGLRRQLFQLQYYTEGNIPEALVGTPEMWTPKQIKDFQDNFDAMLAGNMSNRRRIKFVPGGVAKTFIATKEVELTGVMDTYLAKIVSFAFSISYAWIETKMNRATADTAQEVALEEGLNPIMNWVKRSIDLIIRKYWPSSKLEFVWLEEEDVDPVKQADIITKLTNGALMRPNEGRDRLGLPPDPKGDELRYNGTLLKTSAEEKEAADQKAAEAAAAFGLRPNRSDDPSGRKEGEAAEPAPGAPKAQANGNGSGDSPSPSNDKGGDAEKASSTFRKRFNYYNPQEGSHSHRHDSPHKGSEQRGESPRP